MRILTDQEFLAMVEKDHETEMNKEINQAILELRREARIQVFDDDTPNPLIIKLEETN